MTTFPENRQTENRPAGDRSSAIRLTNSMSRRKELFTPLNAADVRVYVCGPTVYDRAHLGNARSAVAFDTLYRLLRAVYGPQHVSFVRNFTDVDDKINARAAETGRSIGEITAETARWYLEDMAALGVLEPSIRGETEGQRAMPRATAYIPQMVALISRLIDGGHAYTAAGHALFSVASYSGYGRLSGRSVEDMIAGARVEVAPYKRDPMDFVLWKPSAPDEPGWDSPWGRGRPGWHIECSAMAHELLGESFDIHGGGADLMFPHHENEIAQSCCAFPGGGFAGTWLHNEMLQVEGRKMSKSLGNFFTVRDLLDRGIPGEVIRLVFLGSHYRKPMDWTEDKAREAEAHLRKWRGLTAGAVPGAVYAPVLAALADDLNTAGAIAVLHEIAEAIRQQATDARPEFAQDPVMAEAARRADAGAISLDLALRSMLAGSAALLGLLGPELGGWDAVDSPHLPVLADRLAGLRAAAMASKDFAPVDALKAALLAAGVEVRMSKAGVELVPGPGFDGAKLEALL